MHSLNYISSTHHGGGVLISYCALVPLCLLGQTVMRASKISYLIVTSLGSVGRWWSAQESTCPLTVFGIWRSKVATGEVYTKFKASKRQNIFSWIKNFTLGLSCTQLHSRQSNQWQWFDVYNFIITCIDKKKCVDSLSNNSKITTLDFRKADFGPFKYLTIRSPWDKNLKGMGPKKTA